MNQNDPLRRLNTAPAAPAALQKLTPWPLGSGRRLPEEFNNYYRNPDGSFDKTRFQNGSNNPKYEGKIIDTADKAIRFVWPADKAIDSDILESESAPDKVCRLLFLM